MFHAPQHHIQLSPSPWHLLSIREFKNGRENIASLLTLPAETPNPDVSPALTSFTTTTLIPQKSQAQYQLFYSCKALREKKLQLPESSWPQKRQDVLAVPP